MNHCSRLEVYAIGVNGDNIRLARNGNAGKCTGEPGKCGCTHAEINLLKKIPNPISVYVSHSPCLDCAKALVSAGVQNVFYDEEYRIRDGIEYLQECGVYVKEMCSYDFHEFRG